MITTDPNLELRTHTLNHLGVEPAFRDELLAHNQSAFTFDPSMRLQFPWPDEPFIESWDRYAVAVREAGTLKALEPFLPQLRFPIQQGISATSEYAAVTRKGAPAQLFAPSDTNAWTSPDQGFVFLHPTPAGRIAYIYAAERADFVYLVRALSHRNEPVPIPDSMGACVISGYNNWNRIEAHRAAFAAKHGSEGWPAEMKRLAAARAFQDSFLVLSGGPYSGLPAEQTHFAQSDWLTLSLKLRQHHEAAHYFTRRVLGSARNHPCDEAIADFYAMTRVFASFDGIMFLRFFGLEGYPQYRDGGRLQNYRGNPPLSDGAFAGLQQVMFLVAENFEVIDRALGWELRMDANQAAMLLTLCQFTIEEMAAAGFARRFQSSFLKMQKICSE